MVPVLVAIGVVIAGMAITSTYVILEVQKRKNNSEDMDFRCPECGASVDGTVEVCPECNAEFKLDEFECSVCGSAVSSDAKVCMVCNERFEEEETFGWNYSHIVFVVYIRKAKHHLKSSSYGYFSSTKRSFLVFFRQCFPR